MRRLRLMALTVVGMLALAFARPSQAADFGSYAGPDAGYLAFSVTAATSDHNMVQIRRVGPPKSSGFFDYHLGHNVDFTEPGGAGKEFNALGLKPSLHPTTSPFTGQVAALRLAPGRYEVWSISANMDAGVVQFSMTSREVIPFEIVAGQTTYLAEIRMNPIPSGPMGLNARWRIDFVDRSARDMPIARQRLGLPADSPTIIAPVAGRSPG